MRHVQSEIAIVKEVARDAIRKPKQNARAAAIRLYWHRCAACKRGSPCRSKLKMERTILRHTEEIRRIERKAIAQIPW